MFSRLNKWSKTIRPGMLMPDHTVYAGVSPDTGRAMFTTPGDAPLTYTFGQAADYACQLDTHGHNNWRLPTKAELNVLFDNRAAIGGFDTSGLYPGGWYWSRTCMGDNMWAQRFSGGGTEYFFDRSLNVSLRCVRGMS